MCKFGHSARLGCGYCRIVGEYVMNRVCFLYCRTVLGLMNAMTILQKTTKLHFPHLLVLLSLKITGNYDEAIY